MSRCEACLGVVEVRRLQADIYLPSQYERNTLDVVWKDVKDSEWSADHIARHNVTLDEVREVILYRPYWMTAGKSDTTLVYGRTSVGRYLLAVVVDDAGEAFVVTAREMTERERRTYRRKAR